MAATDRTVGTEPASSGTATLSSVQIGTRKSTLALIQANAVRNALLKEHPGTNIGLETVTVRGDADKVTPFLLMGENSSVTPAKRSQLAKNLWTEELETLLLTRKLDILVHCLKDLPTMIRPGTTVAATLAREDPRDVLIVRTDCKAKSLAELPAGSVVGTSSIRRKALVTRLHPHLKVQECRGNVDSRLAKLDAPGGPYSCIILAAAGIIRMNLTHRITAFLDSREFPYAPGQGALALQAREDDPVISSFVSSLNNAHSRWRCLAERSLLHTLQGGCSSPVGTYTKLVDTDGQAKMTLGGIVVHVQGLSDVRGEATSAVSSDEEAEALGALVARQLLDNGANEVLVKMDDLRASGLKEHLAQTADSAQVQASA